jgi:hypothetical protein
VWNVVVSNGTGRCSLEENSREEVKPDCLVVSIFAVEIVGVFAPCKQADALAYTHTQSYFHCEICISADSPFHLMLILKIVTAMGI